MNHPIVLTLILQVAVAALLLAAYHAGYKRAEANAQKRATSPELPKKAIPHPLVPAALVQAPLAQATDLSTKDVDDKLGQSLTIERIMYCVEAELAFARGKFPGNSKTMGALNEEVGEVNRAIMENHYGKATSEDVYAELIQTICMCIRMIQEGDTDYPKYKPRYRNYSSFNVNKG